jgi:hypothetical protein
MRFAITAVLMVLAFGLSASNCDCDCDDDGPPPPQNSLQVPGALGAGSPAVDR